MAKVTNPDSDDDGDSENKLKKGKQLLANFLTGLGDKQLMENAKVNHNWNAMK